MAKLCKKQGRTLRFDVKKYRKCVFMEMRYYMMQKMIQVGNKELEKCQTFVLLCKIIKFMPIVFFLKHLSHNPSEFSRRSTPSLLNMRRTVHSPHGRHSYFSY